MLCRRVLRFVLQCLWYCLFTDVLGFVCCGITVVFVFVCMCVVLTCACEVFGLFVVHAGWF